MKKPMILTLAILLAIAAIAADASTNNVSEYTNKYMKAEYGIVDIQGFDNGMLGKVTLGAEVNKYLSVELQVKYTGLAATETITSTDTTVTTASGTSGTSGNSSNPGNIKPGKGHGNGYWYRRHGPYKPSVPDTQVTSTTNVITNIVKCEDNINYVTITGNIVLDYKNSSCLTPYGDIGWGFSITDGRIYGNKMSVAWLAGLGLQIDLSNNVALDCGVDYVEDWTRDYKITGVNYVFGIKTLF